MVSKIVIILVKMRSTNYNFDSNHLSSDQNGIDDKSFTKKKFKILSTNKYINTPNTASNTNKSESKSINFNKTLNLKLNVSKIQPKYSSYYYMNEKEKNKQPLLNLLNGMEPTTDFSTQKYNTIEVNEVSNKNENTAKFGLTTKFEDFRITNKGKSFNQNPTPTQSKESVLTVKNERSNSLNLNNNILSFNLNNYKVKNNEIFYMTKYNQQLKYKTIDDTKTVSNINNSKHTRSNSNCISSRFEKDILGINFEKFNYLNSLTSKKHYGIVSAFSYNTHNGTSRDYNEDRVSIHLHVKNPILSKNDSKHIKDDSWPVIHFMSVIDGHGGSKCADYIKDNLVKEIVKSSNFPNNIYEAIKEGIGNIEKEFTNKIAVSTQGHAIADYSGSCLVFFLSINTDIYVVNLGDSRAILYRKKGSITEAITIDHKPDNHNELKRINAFGGQTFV